MSFEIRKAERRRVKARFALVGPSGSGKTKSAIKLARGLVGPKGRICVIDTEGASSEMYATDCGGFDVLPLEAPYSPERYVQALGAVEAAGYDVCVLDQISHAWAGKGGVLEFVDSRRGANSGSSFNVWREATPMQQRFVERMLTSSVHIIVTMRSKTEWVIEKDDRGKNVPRKVGMQPVQRDGIEYEFQIVLDLDVQGNIASVSKDRTGQLFGTSFRIEEEHGKALAEFLNSGVEMKTAAASAPAPRKAAVKKSEPEAPISKEQAAELRAKAQAAGMTLEQFKALVHNVCGASSSAEVPASRFAEIASAIEAFGAPNSVEQELPLGA